MPATLRDVAKLAGVSPMAVSKVLHGRGANVRVSDETGARIRAAAVELAYSPNRVARSLQRGRTRTIGLVFETIGPFGTGSRYFGLLLDGIAQTLFGAGYALTLCPMLASGPISQYADGRFDAVIWARYDSNESLFEEIASLEVPVAMLHVPREALGDRGITGVTSDPRPGMEAAVAHLASLGHRQVVWFREEGHEENRETIERFAALRDAAARLGMDAVEGVFNQLIPQETMEAWLRAHPSCGACVLRSESYAPALYAAARESGRRVPEDLSVIGFDSTEFCEALNPALTAISQPVQAMGARAASEILAVIEGRAARGGHFVLPCGFDVRASTARAISGDPKLLEI